ncbi:hypothetical protein [Chryseobacterium koreense]
MKNSFLFLVMLSLALISCRVGEDVTTVTGGPTENAASAYAGTYKGNFSGDDNGNLKVDVSITNVVTVSRVSSKTGSSETYTDGLFEGTFNGNPSTTGFSIFGNLISTSGSFEGTWKQGSLTGTWSLVRQ